MPDTPKSMGGSAADGATNPHDATRPGQQGERWGYAMPTPEDLTELDEEDEQTIRANWKNRDKIDFAGLTKLANRSRS